MLPAVDTLSLATYAKGMNWRKTKLATPFVFVCRQERFRLFKVLRLRQKLGGASEQRTAVHQAGAEEAPARAAKVGGLTGGDSFPATNPAAHPRH
jgi:hypothetical protein